MRRVSLSAVFALVCSVVMLGMLVGAGRASAACATPAPNIVNAVYPEITPAGGADVGDILSTSLGEWQQQSPQNCGSLLSSRLAQWERVVSGTSVPIQGATAQAYTVTSADQGATLKVRIRACNSYGFCTWEYATNTITAASSTSPAPVSPRNGELFRTNASAGSPIRLTIAGNSSACPVTFAISHDPTFPAPPATATQTAPNGVYTELIGALDDRTTYFWRAQFSGGACGTSPWSATANFVFDSHPLGVLSDLPFLSVAGVNVNEATGNLVVSAPAPSYPSLSGSLGAAVTYNAQDATIGALGPGWDVTPAGSGASVPVRLIDHAPAFDAIEIVYATGTSIWFAHVAPAGGASGPGRYTAPVGETSQLTKDTNSGFTLSDDDGSIVTFVPVTSTTWKVASATLPVSKASTAKLVYAFDTSATPQRVTSITDAITGRVLTFTYSGFTGRCADATNPVLLCITGPDANAANDVAYRYVSKSGWTTTHLYRVIRAEASPSTKERVLAEYGYDPLPTSGAGYLQSIRDANDVNAPNDPNVPRSTAFAWSATHKVTITYSLSDHVSTVSEGPITIDSGTQTATWSLDYSCGAIALSTPAQNNHSMPSGITRERANCTLVRGPNQQPSGPQDIVQFDRLFHPLERTDELGRHTLTQYDERGLVLWSEDAYGYPTDYIYDAATHVLSSVEGPGSDPSNVLANRPTTRYGYDEAVPDPDGTGLTATLTSKPLRGLQAAFFTGPDQATAIAFAGIPKAQRTEPASGPSSDELLHATWDSSHLPSGIAPTDPYSVRWKGYFTPPATGTYDFLVRGDGAVHLWIDDQLVIDDWNLNGGVRDMTVETDQEWFVESLSATRHSITLEYAHPAGGTGQTELRWQSPSDTQFVPIPIATVAPGWLNQTSVITPAGLLTSTHYGEPWRGLPDYTSVISPDSTGGSVVNHITTMHYDDYGRLTKKTLPRGNPQTGLTPCTINEPDGHLSGTCDVPEFRTTYAYWTYNTAPDRLVDTGNTPPAAPSGCTPGTSVDTTGQLRFVQQNTATPTKTWYDASGRPVLKQRGAGVWCMQYNDEGRLSVQYAPGEVTTGSISAIQRRTFKYDPTGALAR